MRVKIQYIFASLTIALFGCNQEPDLTFNEPLPEKVDFNYHVKPILSDTCYLCHGPDKSNAKAGLTLSNFDDATEHQTDSGLYALVAGKPEKSEAFQRIMSDDENTIMPPPNSHLTLSPRQKAIIKKWIEQGAEYKKHWALIKPIKPSVPEQNVTWGNNPIDDFIAKQLEMKGLTPSQRADPESLVRRLSFDLTGLPPTIEQIDNYLANSNESATENLIDELIKSPAFGERLATEWLDVARYADTHGYSTDFYRDMSPYRDWVIESFNQNRPFDEFVTWQVAGDLLDNPSQEQVLATAFNRIHAQNGEGGIVNEEFRVEYVKDRVQTIGTGLLGLTMHCAQCHDHKYDPISAKDYYATYAFFNNLDESGQISYDPNDMPVPTILLPNKDEKAKTKELNSKISKLENALQSMQQTNGEFEAWLKTQKNTAKQATGKDALIAHYKFSHTDSTDQIVNSVDAEKPGRVMFGAKPNKKNGPKINHLNINGRSAIKLNGDDALYFPDLKGYHRAKPFSISIDVNLPEEIDEGVLVHYNKAGILYNFKGFDLGIEDNHWIVRFAHSYPYNALKIKSIQPVKRDTWLNVAMSYDGSSKASGIKLYIDGKEVNVAIERDNLYKETEHTREGVKKELGLKIGARWRSKGLPNALVDNFKVYSRELTPLEFAINFNDKELQPNTEELLTLFNKTVNQDYHSTVKALEETRFKHNQLVENIQEIMVMQELPEQRQAYILDRGGYANHGEPVEPGVPERILAFDPKWPKNRLGLAKWLTSKENPLVARVVINRYWQMIFGNGLVRTPEDFGNQGQLPSHPELLDWLAVEFIESGWDVKHMLKLMVSSQTYQQSSRSTPELNEADPENIWLAKGPSARLSAEMIRDNALAASQLLVRKIGGESVKPYQPAGIWKMNNMTYERGTGEDLYRRSMYTIYKRSAPPPNLMAFDAPSRSYSVGTRQRTSTPLQALALLNDPQIIEASKVLANRLMAEHTPIKDKLQKSYRLITSRVPKDDELSIIETMYQQSLLDFTNNPDQTSELLAIGEAKISAENATPELAALTSVTNILMNHDAAVIKR